MAVTAEQLQALIVAELGDSAALSNAVQTVSLPAGVTGGTFTLSYAGQTTAALAASATASDVQAALQALALIDSGNVLVSGGAGGPYAVQFTGTLAGIAVAPLTGDGSGLTGPGTPYTVAVAQTIVGGQGTGGIVAQHIAVIWDSFADLAPISPRLQELYTKSRCIDLLLGQVRGQVDLLTGDLQLKLSQKAATLLAMQKNVQKEIAAYEAQAQSSRAPASGALTTVEPIPPPTVLPLPPSPVPDAQDTRYSGDPYKVGLTGGGWR